MAFRPPPPRKALLPSEMKFNLQYPNEPETLKITTHRAPAYFVWQPGGGNVMETPMNREFNLGFARVSSILGLDRDGANGATLFDTILRNQPEINSIGGRSLGSRAAVEALIKWYRPNIHNVVLISYPFGSPNSNITYSGSACSELKRIPQHVNILFILGDRDDYGKLNADGKSLDASYQWIDAALPNHKVWKVMLRHASHGNNVPPEHGGDNARNAMLQIAGQVAAGWLCGETKSDGGRREGGIWYDVNQSTAYWSGWQPHFNLRTAAEWKI